MLITLGFAKQKQPDDSNVEGELVFFDGQEERIVNFDETCVSLDESAGERGGRPPTVFNTLTVFGVRGGQQEWLLCHND